MTASDDLSYFRARAVQEQKAAQSAQSSEARECHGQLAAKYEARAVQLAICLQLSGGAPISFSIGSQSAQPEARDQ